MATTTKSCDYPDVTKFQFPRFSANIQVYKPVMKASIFFWMEHKEPTPPEIDNFIDDNDISHKGLSESSPNL